MSDFIRHYVIGNDRPAWAIALTRGIISALITGGIGFLGVWSQTDDVKVLIIAGGLPFLTTLSLRFGVEGITIDQRKANGGGR